MTGIALATLSAAAWGASDFIGGRMSRGTSPAALLLVAHVAGLLVLAGVLTTTGLGVMNPRAAGFAAAGGLAELFAVATLYRGLAVAPARVVAPAAAMAPVVTIIIAAALGDPPPRATALALVVVLAGILAVSTPSRSTTGPAPAPGGDIGRGLLLGAVAALGFGVTFAAIDLAVQATDAPGALAATVGVTTTGRVTTVGLLLVLTWARATARPSRRDVVPGAVIGLLIVTGDLAYASATSAAAPGVAAAVATGHTAVTVVLAWAVDRERLSPTQSGGVATVVTGVALLALVA